MLRSIQVSKRVVHGIAWAWQGFRCEGLNPFACVLEEMVGCDNMVGNVEVYSGKQASRSRHRVGFFITDGVLNPSSRGAGVVNLGFSYIDDAISLSYLGY